MLTLFFFIEIMVSILALINGFICITSPKLAIKIQQDFYARINWRIEPINLDKELKNTRLMGIISLALSLILIIYIIYGKIS
jgi:hypothetical protein